MSVVNKEKVREIYEVLPKQNCGFCGFESCGQFARAIAEGRASPFGCRQNPWIGYHISEIIGMKVPAYTYGFLPAFAPPLGVAILQKPLREEMRGLFQKVDNILGRIENLKASR